MIAKFILGLYGDHLGNVRLTYADSDGNGSINPATEIISEKNYYPFGLEHKGYNYIIQNENAVAQNFGYNGKENNPELGLDLMDYGARFYDPSLGKWFTPDALAEKYYSTSPYTYALNNPVIFIDPDGNQVEMCCQALQNFVNDWNAGVAQGHKNFGSNLVGGAIGLLNTSFQNGADVFSGNISSAVDRTVGVAGNAAAGIIVSTFNTVDGAADVIEGRTAEGAAKLTEGVDNIALGLITEGAGRAIGIAGKAGNKVDNVYVQIEKQAIATNPNVNTSTLKPGPNAGSSIPARSKSQSFRKGERSTINEIGSTEGCHTCGSTSSGRTSGNFTPDHQPVSSLVPNGTPQNLYPQCATCSSSQGGTAGGLKRRGYDPSKIDGGVTPNY